MYQERYKYWWLVWVIATGGSLLVWWAAIYGIYCFVTR